MSRGYFTAVLLIAGMFAVACSSGTSSPILPGTGNPELTSGSTGIQRDATSKGTWGIWEVSIDTATWDVTIVPLRGTQFTVDVVTFLQPPDGNPSNLSIDVTDVSGYFDQGLITVLAGLRHPFAGLDMYTGYDVYGALMSPGSLFGSYDADVSYSNGVSDVKLLNPDGYTRWMNPTEFPDTGTILDFTPGNLGIPDISLFTATLNGYKYFADNLDAETDLGTHFEQALNVENRGYFRPGSFNRRIYELQFPMVGGEPALIFQYAVIASWVDPDPALTGDPLLIDVPGDFPYEANADEAIYIRATDDSTLFYIDGSGGGSINLGLEVFDWGAIQDGISVPDEIHQIIVESPGIIPGDFVFIDQPTLIANAVDGTTVISSVFNVEISGCTPMSGNDAPVLVTVESFAPDTFDVGIGVPNNDDRLAGYFRFDLPVLDIIPLSIEVLNPNGGETLYMGMSHEIIWDPGPPGITNVDIEWSTDSFVDDVRTIVENTPNSGSYEWRPIPVEETTTGRVRISNADGIGSDTSDADFSIVLPVWLAFEDAFTFDDTSIPWTGYYPYEHQRDEISPAISQDTDGMVHILFYGVNSGVGSRDMQARSQTGTSWAGHTGFFNSSNINYGRADYAKIAPSHNGLSWACCNLSWISVGWYSDIDRMWGGPGYYCFDGPGARYGYPWDPNYLYPEIATDSAGYVFMFGDDDIPNRIDWNKTIVPGFTAYGGAGQVTSIQPLSINGMISKSRSWARQDTGVALIYYTVQGDIKLAETTDAPANDTWDDSEVIFSQGTDYQDAFHPCINADSSDRLFAAWIAQDNVGDWYILASMRESEGDPWSDPVIVTTSTSQFLDIHISSAQVDMPTGTTEDVAVVGWEVNGEVGSALSPLDLMAFLPEQDVSDTGVNCLSPDVMCLTSTMGYQFDVLFSYTIEDGTNWDITINNADFETP